MGFLVSVSMTAILLFQRILGFRPPAWSMPAVLRDILVGHQEVIAPYWNIWCEYATHVFLIGLTLAWMVLA